jgi:hypothetical protein
MGDSNKLVRLEKQRLGLKVITYFFLGTYDSLSNGCIVMAGINNALNNPTQSKDSMLAKIVKKFIRFALLGILTYSLNLTASASQINYAYLPVTSKDFPPKIVITAIFYDGLKQNEPDEYVEIRNEDAFSVQLSHWTLRDAADHVFTFPDFVIQPGQVCRIYTDENHLEWCGFNYGRSSPVWNNAGDCAYIRDYSNTPIDEYCY